MRFTNNRLTNLRIFKFRAHFEKLIWREFGQPVTYGPDPYRGNGVDGVVGAVGLVTVVRVVRVDAVVGVVGVDGAEGFLCLLSRVYVLILSPQQQHESLVNRLTYGCKPVKSLPHIQPSPFKIFQIHTQQYPPLLQVQGQLYYSGQKGWRALVGNMSPLFQVVMID